MSAQYRASLAAAAVAIGCMATSPSLAQDQPGTPQDQTIVQNPNASTIVNAKTASSGSFLEIPQVNNIPGGVKVPLPKSPVDGDKNAVQRGMKYFTGFNCVGCHAPNGGGGIGPSLSNTFFKFGADLAQMYNVIAHGGPQGMPAWGSVLPDSVIWDLTAYIQSISQAPTPQWGTTTNIAEHLPSIEQVPAEFMNTVQPWQHTQPFSSGQKPTSHNPTSVGVGAQPAEQKK
jgi:cytochrome c oxidase cbb3-type subunit III